MKFFIGMIISLAVFYFFKFISSFFMEIEYHIGWLAGAIVVWILRYYNQSLKD